MVSIPCQVKRFCRSGFQAVGRFRAKRGWPALGPERVQPVPRYVRNDKRFNSLAASQDLLVPGCP